MSLIVPVSLHLAQGAVATAVYGPSICAGACSAAAIASVSAATSAASGCVCASVCSTVAIALQQYVLGRAELKNLRKMLRVQRLTSVVPCHLYRTHLGANRSIHRTHTRSDPELQNTYAVYILYVLL